MASDTFGYLQRLPISYRLFALGEKDEVQYRTRLKTAVEAERLLTQLGEFADWVEKELARPH